MLRRRSTPDENLTAPELTAAQLIALVEGSHDILVGLDSTGVILYASPNIDGLGQGSEAYLGLPVVALVVDQDMERVADLITRVMGGHDDEAMTRTVLRSASGEPRIVDMRITSSEVGSMAAVVAIVDVTDRLRDQRQRRRSERLFETAFRYAPIGMAVQGRGSRFIQVNSALCHMLGYTADELIGRTSLELTHPDDVELSVEHVRRSEVGELDTFSYEKRFNCKDGSTIWAAVHVSLVRRDDGTPTMAILQVEDITERRQLVDRLAHQANHDVLTGLPNRVAVMDHLSKLLADETLRLHVAVLLCDLDEFKLVNDTLGHHVGDRLLEVAAQRLRAVLRPEDMVGRFGGDEFVIVCQDVVHRTDATIIAARLIDALSTPIVLDGEPFQISTSVGVAYSMDADSNPEVLLRHADTAMYRAKGSGRGQFATFHPSHHQGLVHRAETERGLRRAIEHDELAVYYQPCISLTDGALHGFEALVRWHHPTRGPLGPDEFIDLAESSDLILPLGAYVLRTACRHLSLWRGRGVVARDCNMAVNVSARQLSDPSLVEIVRSALIASDLPAAALTLEITERALLDGMEASDQPLERLRALGVSLAVDDFGTGYSSLTHLKHYPFDTLKIDRTFVDGLGTEPNDEAIVAAVVGMANALDLWVIAEGIETQTHLDVLRGYHVPLGQGYKFARPMPALEVEWWLADRAHAADPW